MVDVRGHGKSEAPDHRYSYKTMATELAGLINGLQLDRPVVLGHSMGAMITLVLAGLFPDLPRAILLEDPPPFWGANQPKPGDDENQRSMIAWMTELKRKTHSELLAEVKQLNPTWAVEELGPWADAKHRFSLRITALIESDMKAEGIPELIQHITCRSLLITADPELGAILTNDDVAGLKNLLPHLEVENIPGAGHNIRREQFKDYLGVVQNFLSVNVN
jgi:pimeloyl-ACP methyl ester carboxylesterase